MHHAVAQARDEQSDAEDEGRSSDDAADRAGTRRNDLLVALVRVRIFVVVHFDLANAVVGIARHDRGAKQQPHYQLVVVWVLGLFEDASEGWRFRAHGGVALR